MLLCDVLVSSVLRAQCVACVSLNVLEKRGLIHKAAAHALAARNSQGEHNGEKAQCSAERIQRRRAFLATRRPSHLHLWANSPWKPPLRKLEPLVQSPADARLRKPPPLAHTQRSSLRWALAWGRHFVSCLSASAGVGKSCRAVKPWARAATWAATGRWQALPLGPLELPLVPLELPLGPLELRRVPRSI